MLVLHYICVAIEHLVLPNQRLNAHAKQNQNHTDTAPLNHENMESMSSPPIFFKHLWLLRHSSVKQPQKCSLHIWVVS